MVSVVVGNRLAVVLAVVGRRFLTLVNGGVCAHEWEEGGREGGCVRVVVCV